MKTAAIRIDATIIGLLILGLGLGTVLLGLNLPPWLWPVMAGLGWWRWHLARHRRPPPPPRIRIAIGLGLTAGLILTGNIGLGLEAAIPLFIGFLWLKLLELDNANDLLMTAGLGSFLAGADVLLDQSLDQVALAFVIVVILWTAVVMAHRPLGPTRWRNLRPSLAVVLRMGAQALPLTAILFVLLPRPAVRLNLPQGQARSGLSDHLTPGMVANLAKDQTVAFRVVFPDGEHPRPADLYWRGLVLTETDGQGWYRPRNRFVTPGYSPPPRALDSQRTSPDILVRQDITLLPHGQNWLYGIDPPATVQGDGLIGRGNELIRPQAVTTPFAYRVATYLGREAADAGNATLAQAQQLPDTIHPRIAELATTWQHATVARGGGVDAQAAVAAAWFQQQGFTYTLEPGRMEGDPVADFLFEQRRGFCSHYATAYALLARLQGFPARVIVGFRGGEWNEPGGFLVVRNAHAHAWCELYDRTTASWRRIDPTSALTEDRIERIARDGGAAENASDDTSWFAQSQRSLRQWWDWADAGWQGWMYRFDAGFQFDVARKLGAGEHGRWGLLGLSIIGATLTLLALALILLRRRTPRLDAATRLYQRWCRPWRRQGLIRAASETPRTFAHRLVTAHPDASPAIMRVTTAYEQVRYGRDDGQGLELLRAAMRGSGPPAAIR